jgi:Tol biopolymer transport system component
VFGSNRTGSFEIWICDSDGSNQQRLTSLGVFCGSPQWSPDGERMAFQSILEGQWGIFVTSADGGKPKRLTSSPVLEVTSSWSRDGGFISLPAAAMRTRSGKCRRTEAKRFR